MLQRFVGNQQSPGENGTSVGARKIADMSGSGSTPDYQQMQQAYCYEDMRNDFEEYNELPPPNHPHGKQAKITMDLIDILPSTSGNPEPAEKLKSQLSRTLYFAKGDL